MKIYEFVIKCMKLIIKKLTFSAVIFDNKGFSHGFTDPSTFLIASRNNFCTKPEFPAPNPAGVVGEFYISDGREPFPHGDGQVSSGKQRPLASSLLDDFVVKLFAGPSFRVSGKVAVENNEFDFDGVIESDRNHWMIAVHKKDLKRTVVHVCNLASGEYWKRKFLAESESQA